MCANLKNRFSTQLTAALVERGVATDAELTPLRQEADGLERCLADLLVERKAAAPEAVLTAASDVLGLPSVTLSDANTDMSILDAVPARVAHALKVMPLFVVGNEATVAMADPFDLEKIDELSFRIGKTVIPVFALAGDIERHLERYYGPLEEDRDAPGSIEYEDETPPDAEADADDAEPRYEEGQESDSPIVRVVDLILRIALEEDATDIHIEPRETAVIVRNRVDGLLREKPYKIPYKVNRAIVSRIKILAGIDIAERRLPQDGKIALRYEGRNIDLRVSTFPTIRGEKVVLRVLDRARRNLDLEALGLSSADLERWQRLLRLRDGLILVTGPTGCGKTSTLYASLDHMKSPELNIVTLEDPVERDDCELAQGQVNAASGFTFARGLRAVLRQDPDVILVGEIRDSETAQIAAQAALTGHLVLATLHTTDAPSAVTRLADIGLPPYLIAATLRAVLAQRLVRRSCLHCAGHGDGGATGEEGCRECGGSGYKGRVGIYELLVIDSELKGLIASGAATEGQIREQASRQNGLSLWQDGMRKVEGKITTLPELRRIVPDALAAEHAPRAAGRSEAEGFWVSDTSPDPQGQSPTLVDDSP